MEKVGQSLSFPNRRCPSWRPDCLLSNFLPDRFHRWPRLPRKYRLRWDAGHITRGSGAKSPRDPRHGLHPSRLQPQPEAQRPGGRTCKTSSPTTSKTLASQCNLSHGSAGTWGPQLTSCWRRAFRSLTSRTWSSCRNTITCRPMTSLSNPTSGPLCRSSSL